MKLPEIKKFPPGFLWGSATSAYQVEGGIENNDWAASGMPPAGLACDHYHRYEQDFNIAKKLNHNAHRLSLEWSRIEPRRGEWDDEELQHYYHVLEFLKKNGLTTFATLHHFTNPVWIARQGGWLNKKTIDDFASFTAKVAQSLGQFIDFWVTINEPNIYASLAFLSGIWPPFEKSLSGASRVYRHMLLAHNQAYKIIHAYYPRAQVGFAQNFSWRRPARKYNPFEQLAVRGLDFLTYRYPYHRTQNDFIGVNHYTDTHLKLTLSFAGMGLEFKRHPGSVTERGWAIHPHAIYQVLRTLKTLQKPIYITENGLADAGDRDRSAYIRGYLAWVHKAIKSGVDIRGYLHWSLLDNFEWEDGYQWKFGLVEVDFKDKRLTRHIRDSAEVYARICKNNSL